MKNLVILISGRGSNMQAIVRACARESWPARVAAVISNRPEAAGLAFAASQGIATAVVDHRQFADRAAFDAALARAIKCFAPDLVVLAGFMRVLTDAFVARHAGRLLNIHPSLLPGFPGLNTHQRALDAGVRLHGASVHFVTPELDHGPIVAQAAVPVRDGDDAATLGARVLAAEHVLYPRAVRWFVEGRLAVAGLRVRLAPRGASGASRASGSAQETGGLGRLEDGPGADAGLPAGAFSPAGVQEVRETGGLSRLADSPGAGLPAGASSPDEVQETQWLFIDETADAGAGEGAETVGAAGQAKAGAHDAKPGAQVDASADTNACVQTRAQTSVKADTTADAEVNAKIDVQTGAQAGAEAGVRGGAKARAKVDAQTSAQASAEADTKAGVRARAKVNAQTGAQADVQTDAQASARTSAKSSVKPGAKTDAKPNARQTTEVPV